MLPRAGTISLILWALAASQAGATTRSVALSSTTTTEAPESTAATPTEPPTAPTTTTTDSPSTGEQPQTTPTTASATSSTAAPQVGTGAADLGADGQSPGESRLSVGGQRVFEAPGWLGIVKAKPVYADRFKDPFGGLIISVGAHRLVMHSLTLERAHQDKDLLELVGFGMKEYHPEAKPNRRKSPVNFEFYKDSTLTSGLMVGNFSFFEPHAHPNYNYSNIALAPLEWNATASTKVGDCFLLSYAKDENSAFRHLTRMPVELINCDNTKHECIFFARHVMENLHDWGICEEHQDLGSPVVCNSKLSFIVSEYTKPDALGCHHPFIAVKLAHFAPQIGNKQKSSWIKSADGKTLTSAFLDPKNTLKHLAENGELDFHKPSPVLLAKELLG